MPWPKLFKCFPCKPKKLDQTDNGNGSDKICLDQDGFTKKQKAKAVAIVLSGYDAEIAAASVGPPCESDTVLNWVELYRPVFFEAGMRCPPALILWWMKEIERKSAEAADNCKDTPDTLSSDASIVIPPSALGSPKK